MIVGREREFNVLSARLDRMLAGTGSVLFITGEAGLGKTTLVHEWWNGENAKWKMENANADSASAAGEFPIPVSLFLESACSIPIGNVDVGRMEALQPWADVIGQLDGDDSSSAPPAASSENKPIDLKKLAKDSASTWALAVPMVGGFAYAALETSRLVKEQRARHATIDLKQLLRDAAPAWAWALPVVGDVVHAAAETARLAHEQVHGGDDSVRNALNQEQVFQQYANLLGKVALDTPLVIFLDDLHWADTTSCNLLFHLSRQIADKRILVICTYRLDDALAALDGKGHPILTVQNEILRYQCGEVLTLAHLDADAVRDIMRGAFPAYTPDPVWEAWLLKHSGGNALFVTQYIKTLREDRLLNDSGAFVGDYHAIGVPPTALAVVQERARRLDEATRTLLMYATAEGEEFTAYVLEHLTERKPLELLGMLHAAVKQGLIVQKGKSRMFANTMTAHFGFSHALFHKALYDQLIDAQKDFLHRQCFELLRAEWERAITTPPQATPLGSKLLTHAEKCEEWAVASDVAFALAQHSAATYANDEALAMCAACLRYDTLLPDAPRRGAVHYLQGTVLANLSRYEDAATAFAAAAHTFDALGMNERAIDAINGRASALLNLSRYQDARDLLATLATTYAETLARWKIGEAVALRSIGSSFTMQGDYQAALDAYTKSLAIAESVNDMPGACAARGGIGDVLVNIGSCEEALAHYRHCLDYYQSVDNRPQTANACSRIGYACKLLGQYPEAIAFFDRCYALHASTGSQRGLVIALLNKGSTLLLLGDVDAALPCFESSLALLASMKDKHLEANALLGIVNVNIRRQEYAEALERLAACLVLYESIGEKAGGAEVYGRMGIVHALVGNDREALACFDRAHAICEEIGLRQLDVFALYHRGETLLRMGRTEDAGASFTKGLSMATEIGNTFGIGCCHGGMGRLQAKRAEALTGDARTAMLRDAEEHLRTCVQIGVKTQNKELQDFAGDLDRVSALLGTPSGQ